MEQFNVVVIGGGPGGYPAAIRAAQLGKKVALIEADALGGTCLNRGCIPSKTLVASAKALRDVKNSEKFGIKIEHISWDYKKMVERKDQVVARVLKGLEGLVASNQIKLIRGFGKFTSPKQIKVSGEEPCEIRTEQTIIATGSEPKEMPSFPFDGKKIHSSTTLLNLKSLPKKLLIIGGGIIGCEFASLYAEFGVEVIILEVLPRIIPMECISVSTALTKAFDQKGIKIHTNVFVENIDTSGEGVVAHLAGGKTIKGDIALVATGRKLNVDRVNLAAAGVRIKENGLIDVDNRMETNVPGIYAVGDIASRWWLAHVASHQGLVAASNACGEEMEMHYNAVPSVIFTEPEIATVGYTLEQAIEKGYRATLGSFPFNILGKAQATLHTEGFAQVVTDRETGQILGAQVVGHGASTLIAEMGIVIANEMTLECVTHTIHAHPTIAEAWLEAALIANEQPLHYPPKVKKQ